MTVQAIEKRERDRAKESAREMKWLLKREKEREQEKAKESARGMK